jgi:hypothetical protein
MNVWCDNMIKVSKFEQYTRNAIDELEKALINIKHLSHPEINKNQIMIIQNTISELEKLIDTELEWRV